MMEIKDDFTPRGSWWSITLNNPTQEDFQKVKGQPPRWLKMIKGQEEIGEETGTHHLQMVINTDFIRASQVKDWLYKAHIKLCKTQEHRDNCLTYVEKAPTAIEGTRFHFTHRQESEQLTMATAMLKLAEYAWEDDKIKELTNVYLNQKHKNPVDEVLSEEYWSIVRLILMDNENMVALFTQPQYLRAWVKTRRVWVAKIASDRQTEVRISEK